MFPCRDWGISWGGMWVEHCESCNHWGHLGYCYSANRYSQVQCGDKHSPGLPFFVKPFSEKAKTVYFVMFSSPGDWLYEYRSSECLYGIDPWRMLCSFINNVLMRNIKCDWICNKNNLQVQSILTSGTPWRIWARQGPIFYPKFFWPVVSYKSVLKPKI